MDNDRIEVLLGGIGCSVPPGTKWQGFLRVEGFSPDFDVPVVLTRGSEPGPIAVVIGGIHGGEHNSIEGPRRVACDLDPTKLKGLVAIVPVANRAAFHARSHNGSPPDGQNLARLFPGSPDGTALERVAYAISSKLLQHADAVLELHGADALEVIIPHVYVPEHQPGPGVSGQRPWTEWDLADMYCIEVIAATPHRDPGSPVNVSASAGIPSILAEAGSGDLDEHAIRIHYRGITNVLRRMGILAGLPLIDQPARRRVRYSRVQSPRSGFFYPKARVGQPIEKDQVLGEVTDYFGHERDLIRAPVSGVVGFIKKTMATNEGNGLFSIATDLKD